MRHSQVQPIDPFYTNSFRIEQKERNNNEKNNRKTSIVFDYSKATLGSNSITLAQEATITFWYTPQIRIESKIDNEANDLNDNDNISEKRCERVFDDNIIHNEYRIDCGDNGDGFDAKLR